MSAPRGSLAINGQIIPLAEIKKRAAELRHSSGWSTASSDEIAHSEEEAANALIERTLLVQEALRLNGEPPATVIDSMVAEGGKRYDGVAGCRAGSDTPSMRDDLRRRLLIDSLLERWRSNVRRPSAEEVRTFYGRNKQSFFAEEQIWASQIVRPLACEMNVEAERALTEDLRQRVAKGEDFAVVATGWSGCPENGGNLGWFQRGVMVPEFDEAVFGVAAGELSPVFQTIFGFHFALVHARRKAGIPSLNEIRPRVEQFLWRHKQERFAENQLQLLYNHATIRRTV